MFRVNSMICNDDCPRSPDLPNSQIMKSLLSCTILLNIPTVLLYFVHTPWDHNNCTQLKCNLLFRLILKHYIPVCIYTLIYLVFQAVIHVCWYLRLTRCTFLLHNLGNLIPTP